MWASLHCPDRDRGRDRQKIGGSFPLIDPEIAVQAKVDASHLVGLARMIPLAEVERLEDQ
jgi:hypothetical protein